MTFAARFVLLGLVAVTAAGCGSSMRSSLERQDPPEIQAAARQDLSMPPDLRLPAPGSAPAAAAAPQAPAPAYDSTAAAAAPVEGAQQTASDPYTAAGISLYKPDGTKKSDEQLRKELREYHIAQKKQKNPNYGTVMNIGNIFSDE